LSKCKGKYEGKDISNAGKNIYTVSFVVPDGYEVLRG
jgi:hypothetical protein